MSNLKHCLNGKHPIPKDDYYCEQCGDNWEGDETGKWAEHYFQHCQTLEVENQTLTDKVEALEESLVTKEAEIRFCIGTVKNYDGKIKTLTAEVAKLKERLEEHDKQHGFRSMSAALVDFIVTNLKSDADPSFLLKLHKFATDVKALKESGN